MTTGIMTSSSEKVEVDVDLKESDIQRANFWFQFGKWSRKLPLIVFPLLGLLLLSQTRFSKIIENPIAATSLFVFFVYPIFFPALIWFQAKRNFANLRGFQKRVRFEFSADGYEVSDNKSSGQIKWDAILRAAESRHSFHLFFHKSLFHTIPKRCFKSLEDVERLRAILKNSLGS